MEQWPPRSGVPPPRQPQQGQPNLFEGLATLAHLWQQSQQAAGTSQPQWGQSPQPQRPPMWTQPPQPTRAQPPPPQQPRWPTQLQQQPQRDQRSPVWGQPSQPQPRQQPQQPQQAQQPDLFAGLAGLADVWQRNLTDLGHTDSSQDHEEAIRSNRARAEGVLHQLGVDPGPTSNPHLGLPRNLKEWADLGVEGAMLPKTHLHSGFTKGLDPQTLKGLGGAPMTPERQKIMKEHWNFVLETLANEPNMKWERINWVTPQEGALLAKRTQKPLFIELIVGRLADASSDVC